MQRLLFIILISLGCFACNPRIAEGIRKSDIKKDVELVTDKGTIVLRLSDETPQHRNNFIRLVHRGVYDSILFHRVVKDFLVQTGDPRTKPSIAAQGSSANVSDLMYTIPAEFSPNLFHKRGAVNAARTGDETNPLQASSGTQFTLIQGRVFTDSALTTLEKRVTRMNAYNKVLRDPINKPLMDKLREFSRRTGGNADSAKAIRDHIEKLTDDAMTTITPYKYSPEQRKAYTTIGGAPHLDGNYTVFGEVISGLDVVDKIATVQVGQNQNREKPVVDVRIISAKLIPRKQ